MNRSVFLLVLAILLLAGCSDGSKDKIAEMQETIDSLKRVDANRQNDIGNLTMFIETLSEGLDSIAQQEHSLFYTNKGKEGTTIDRKQLRKNLEMFQQTLIGQRERIAQLADSLKRKGADMKKLNKIIDYLNQQLDSKDLLIKALRADLEKKTVNINELNDKVTALTEDNTKLNQQIEMQAEALTTQSNEFNQAYVKIGTKRELKSCGLLSGGFLKKTKVNYTNLQTSLFTKVDIRTMTEIPINSSNVKVMSPMPVSSYTIVREDDGRTILRILDPSSFWSVSNYLIIQAN